MKVNDLLSMGIRTCHQMLHVGSQISFRGCFDHQRRFLLLTKMQQIFKPPSVGFHRMWAELSVGLELEPFLS